MFPMIPYSANTINETGKEEASKSDSREILNEIRDEFRFVESPTAACNTFQYSRIANQSPSTDSTAEEPPVIEVTATATADKRHSDQKLPPNTKSSSPSVQSVKSFVYVNKNGYAKLIQTELNEDKEAKRQTIAGLNTSQDYNQSVPMQQLNATLNSSTGSLSLVQTNQNGQIVQINTSAMMNEEFVDIKQDHVKMLSLMAILCCWCFPFTGIPALFYTRLMKKFYNLNDMIRAKQYLIKSERLVLLTFFLGFTLTAILFAILQIYFFDIQRAHTNNATESEVWEPSHRYFIHH